MGVSTSNAGPRFRLQAQVGHRHLVFDLGPGSHRVGSRQESDVCVALPGVSREHAVVTVNGSGLAVEDRGSKNGTTVDGAPVQRAALLERGTVGFGSVLFRVERIDAGAELAIRCRTRSDSSFLTTREDTPTLTAFVVREWDEAAAHQRLHFPAGYRAGTSPAMGSLYRQMQPLTLGDLSVLIHGETGAGKELIAQTLHRSSARAAGPFVAINCAAIPKDLLEAELFGVTRGAATGVVPRQGLFQQAEGGTLFLDEVTELPLEVQPKLLRCLQEREVRPIGGAVRPLDVRILAATNALPEAGGKVPLREDLYYRLAGAVLSVPPLRRCREDIAGLAAHFLERFSERAGIFPEGMTAAALQRMQVYSWPGNVRELEQEIHRLVLNAQTGEVLEPEMLSEPLRQARAGIEQHPSEMESMELVPRLKALEREMLREAMLRTGGRLGEAAKLLGLSRNGLAKKLNRFDLRHSWAADRPDSTEA